MSGFLDHVSLRAKAFASPIIILAFLLMVGVVTLGNAWTIRSGANRLLDTVLPKSAAVTSAADLVTENHVLLFRFVTWLNSGIEKSELDKLQAKLNERGKALDAAVLELAGRNDWRSEENKLVAEIAKGVKSYRELALSTVEMGQIQQSMAPMMLGQADDLFSGLMLQTDSLIRLSGAETQEVSRQVATTVSYGSAFVLAVVGLAIASGLAVTFIVTASLVQPMNAVAAVIDGIVERNGADFDPAYAKRRDEFGALVRNIGVLRGWLNERDKLFDAEAERTKRAGVILEEARELVARAERGDFSMRITTATDDPDLQKIVAGLNAVNEAIDRSTAELELVLSSLTAGTLNVRVAGPYEGRLGDIQRALNVMAERFAAIIQGIRDTSLEVDGTAREIASGSHQLSRQTEEQAAALAQTAATAAVLSASVKATASSSQQSFAMMRSTKEEAEQGGVVVREAIAAMDRIEDAARGIVSITAVIDEIAFETNMLALNAAVEAARAGDAGAGFAIVAAEVRNLSQRSAESARQISKLIARSTKEIEFGVEQVKNAGSALDRIVGSVSDATTVIRDISVKTDEQAKGIGELTEFVAKVDTSTHQNAALAEQSAASAAGLAQRTRTLRDLVSAFHGDEQAIDHRQAQRFKTSAAGR